MVRSFLPLEGPHFGSSEASSGVPILNAIRPAYDKAFAFYVARRMHYARGYRQETIIHQDGKLRVIRNHLTRPEPAILVKIICPSDEQRVRGGRCDWSGM